MKKVKIREVAEQIRGVSYTPADAFDAFLENTIPLLRANNIQNLTANYNDLVYVRADKVGSKQLLKINDILICASSGSKHLVGKACVIKKEYGTFGAFCKVLRPNAQTINPAYFSHYFQSAIYRKTISELAAGANINNIKNEHLDELAIALPDMPTQEGIARKLDAICRLITLREQQLKKLDQLASSRFIEMFGDPVANPRKWDIKKISDFATVKIGPFGSALHADDYITQGHPVINPSHIVDGTVVPDNLLTISESKYCELSAYHLRQGDVVIGRRGEIGRAAVIADSGLLCGTGSIFVRISDSCRPDFLQRTISHPTFKAALEDKAVGVTMKNLNAGMIESSYIPLPPIELQDEFAVFVEQLDKSKVICNKMHKMVEFSLFRV